jgi:hypothetical protein
MSPIASGRSRLDAGTPSEKLSGAYDAGLPATSEALSLQDAMQLPRGFPALRRRAMMKDTSLKSERRSS